MSRSKDQTNCKNKIQNSELAILPVDFISEILDNCRWWQLRTIFIIYLTKIPTAFFMAAIIYSAPVPDRVTVFCKDTTETNSTIQYRSIFHPSVVDINDQEFILNLCDTHNDIKEHAWLYFGHRSFQMPWLQPNLIQDADVNELVPCDVFDYNSGYSITAYDIVCSRGALVVLTQGMHLVGIFLSGIVARYAMKATSPKAVLRLAMLLQIICGPIAGLVGSLIIHLIFRALAAIGCAAAFTAGFVIYITKGKFRIASQIFFDIFWSIGILMLSVITQYEARWTQLYMIISFPTLIILFLTIWLPDSPRWLLKRGNLKEVEMILVDASNSFFASAIIPVNFSYHLKLQATALVNEPPPARWFDLWRSSTMTQIKIFSIHVAFSCFTIMYFGMVLNMPNYGRKNLPKSALIIALSEIIGCCIGYILAVKCKVKFLSSGMFNLLGAGIAFTMWHWSEYESHFVHDGTLLYFCLVLKASVSCSFAILISCATDLVTNNKKAILLFSCLLCGRLWLLNAPVMVSLGSFFGEFLSLTLFGITGCIGGLAMILIELTLTIKSN